MPTIDPVLPEVQPDSQNRNLTDPERRAVYEKLLTHFNDGKLKNGAIAQVAGHFGISTRTVSRIWKRGQDSIAAGSPFADVSSHRKKNCGRKVIPLNLEALKEVPLLQRQNIRSLSAALEVPKSTLHDKFKSGQIRRTSNTIKPLLTEKNKMHRLQFALEMLDPNSPTPKFQEMLDCIHIDEKWFYITRTKQTLYLAPDEPEPQRICKSKKFIGKVMFLAAVARPRWDHSRNKWFNGRIGIWPFVTKEKALRSSKNRAKGTPATKPITVDKQVYRQFLLEKLIPAIKAKWPRRTASQPIFVQQDNAKPHISPTDEQFVLAGSSNGFDIRLRCQPPNSPDFNVLDLGFFNAIQSLQHQISARDIDSLILATEKAFEDLDDRKLNNVFLTLQQCMISTMEVGGGNDYKIKHMNKESLERADSLPDAIVCDPSLIGRVKEILSNHE